MRLIGDSEIDAYSRKHPESAASLNRWRKVVKETKFSSVSHLKLTFPRSYDYVRPCCHVFDIANNRHRLIALIDFKLGLVNVVDLMDHKRYDGWRCQ